MPITSAPLFHITIELFPSAKIEIADAEVSAVRHPQRLLKFGKKKLLDIVEDSWHVDSVRSGGEECAQSFGSGRDTVMVA